MNYRGFENLLVSFLLFVLFDKMLGRHICLAQSCDFSSFMANKLAVKHPL